MCLYRQAKKGCDQKRPTCSRCRRLHQACHGYNETGTTSSYDQSTELDLAATTRPIRAGTHDMSTSVDFFEQQFYTRYTCFIKYFKQHEIVAKLMSACSLSVLDARGLVKRDDTTVMSLYVDILGAVGGRIRNPQTAMEDATVVATILLYLLEVSAKGVLSEDIPNRICRGSKVANHVPIRTAGKFILMRWLT